LGICFNDILLDILYNKSMSSSRIVGRVLVASSLMSLLSPFAFAGSDGCGLNEDPRYHNNFNEVASVEIKPTYVNNADGTASSIPVVGGSVVFDVTPKDGSRNPTNSHTDPLITFTGPGELLRSCFNPKVRITGAGTVAVTVTMNGISATASVTVGQAATGVNAPGAVDSSPLKPDWPVPVAKPTDMGQLIQNIFLWSLSVVGLVVFVSFFYSGFMWLWGAAGNPSKIAQAKEQLFNTMYGAILLFSAYVILRTINPDLVGNGTGEPCDPVKPKNCLPALPSNKSAAPAGQPLPVANPK
jgi:hypothetical protein